MRAGARETRSAKAVLFARRCLVALALAGAQALPCAAQERAPTSLAGVFYDGDFFSGSSSVWSDWWALRGLATRSFGERLTLGLEASVVHRFDLRDRSLAADAWVDLWPGAYTHVRAKVAPEARLMPLSEWALTLFHALPGGWEASANVRLMNLPGADVRIAGLGMAKYVSRWYLRARASVAELAGEGAGAAAVFARRFLGGDSRQYVEAGAGLGAEMVIVGAGPVLDARDTWFVAATFQRFLLEPFGLHVSAGLNDFEGVPLRRHLSLGLIARF